MAPRALLGNSEARTVPAGTKTLGSSRGCWSGPMQAASYLFCLVVGCCKAPHSARAELEVFRLPRFPVSHPLLCLVLPKPCVAPGPSPGAPCWWALLIPMVLLSPCALAWGWESPVLLGVLTSGMCLGRAWQAATRAHGHSSHSSSGCPGRLCSASWQLVGHSPREQHQNSHWVHAVPAARTGTFTIPLPWGDSYGKPLPSGWGSPGGSMVPMAWV